MWDFDSKEIDFKNLTYFANEYGIRIHVIETSRGYHFISFACLDVVEVEELHQAFRIWFKSDYPTISEVRDEDLKQGQEFHGTTLRITQKAGDLKYVGCYDPTRKENIEKASKRLISGGHLYLYSLITENHIGDLGQAVNTRLILCSFLKNNKRVMIL